MTKLIHPGRIEIKHSVGSKKDIHEGSDSFPVTQQESLPASEHFSDATSQISVTLGLTKSLGNYEFARVDVTVTEQCRPDDKDNKFKELYKVASDYVAKVNSDITTNKKV